MPRGRPRKYPLPNSLEENLKVLTTVENTNQKLNMSIPEPAVVNKEAVEKILTNLQEEKNETFHFKPAFDPNVNATLSIDKSAKTISITDNPCPLERTDLNLEKANSAIKQAIPPFKRERNEYGFLTNVEYVFKEDGRVDWRKMIKPAFLTLNREKKDEIEKTYGKKFDEISVTEVEDKHLLILLFGIRYLASLRGYYIITPKVEYCSDYKAVVTTNIHWIANNDTEGLAQSFGDTASATPENTNGFGKNFLESIAANRSFVRAVRNYLEIQIVGADEIKNEYTKNETAKSVEYDPLSPQGVLNTLMESLGVTFNQLKKNVEDNHKDKIKSDCTKWGKISDIPPNDCYILASLLKAKLEEKKAK